MITANKECVIVGGAPIDLVGEFYAITQALINKAPEVVLAVTARTSEEITQLIDDKKINDFALNVLIAEVNKYDVREDKE